MANSTDAHRVIPYRLKPALKNDSLRLARETGEPKHFTPSKLIKKIWRIPGRSGTWRRLVPLEKRGDFLPTPQVRRRAWLGLLRLDEGGPRRSSRNVNYRQIRREDSQDDMKEMRVGASERILARSGKPLDNSQFGALAIIESATIALFRTCAKRRS